MGDRVLVTFTDKDNTDYTPAIYMHWAGDAAAELIRNAQPMLRRGDPSYAAARFCGECHKSLTGELGLGLLDAPKPSEPGFAWEDYSHGDAGVYVVNVDTGEVACHAGYGEGFQLDPDAFAEV